MKVLYLVNHFAEYGGIEQMLDHKFRALKSFYNDTEIVLVTRFQKDRDFIYDSHNFTKKYDLNCDAATNGMIEYLRFYKQLRTIVAKEQPDVIVSTLTSYYAMIVPFVKNKIPKLVEFHSTAATIKAGQWKLKRFFYNRYDAVVVLNQEEARSYDLSNIQIIPNFIHSEKEHSYPLFSSRAKTIIAAGRLDAVKQFDHLILAWKQLKTEFPNWKVEIYGVGSEYDFLKQYIDDNEMSDSVQLMGKTNELLSIMEKSSIYCLTSKTECFPMVLLEAKAVGLPIVSYDCPFGPKHIVKNGEDGILVTMDDIDGLASTLTSLIENKDKRERMSIEAFQNAKQFSSQEIIGSWVSLFKRFKK